LDLDSTPDISKWSYLESRVEKNFSILLDIINHSGKQVTFFFLGWIVEKYPDLVKNAMKSGHEIASHGYSHQLVYSQNRSDFSNDLKKSKNLIEDICGKPCLGYRAPGFSITEKTPWFYDELAKQGYKYSSSLFPASRGHGGIKHGNIFPHKIKSSNDIVEFPLTVTNIIGKNICFFGGGYLRLFPTFLINHMGKKVNQQNRPIIYYLHPREIDMKQPHLPMNWKRKFKSYYNLKSSKPKLKNILKNDLITCEEWISLNNHKLI
jgi:polysaccharide deacetylase family protein (PEP-CTERM system associated)